jgi:dihydrofolate reductase
MDELEEFKSNIIVIVSTKFKRDVQLFDYKSYDPNRILFTETFQEAVDLIIDNYLPIVNQMIAIGGTNIYSEAIKSPYFSRFYLTRIFKHFDCDAFLETEDFRTNNLKKLGNHELLKESLLYQCQYNTIKTSNDGIDYVFEAYEKN